MNRFPRVMAVRLGYDPGQVDDFVRRIERTLGLGPLDGPPVTGDEIRNAKFAVKLGGYNETAVDFALDAFIVAVEAPAARTAAPSLRTRAEERTRPDPAPAKAAGAASPGWRRRRPGWSAWPSARGGSAWATARRRSTRSSTGWWRRCAGPRPSR